jgi:hypothetical protein
MKLITEDKIETFAIEVLKTLGWEGCGTKLTGVQIHQIMPDTRRS